MKFGLMSLDFKRFSLEHCFAMAKAYGFDGLEIFCCRRHVYLPSFTPSEAKTIQGYIKKYGIEVPMLTPNTLGQEVNICSVDPSERDDGLTLLKQGVDAAEMIGIPRVLVTADHPGYLCDETKVWNSFVEVLKELTAYAVGKGIKIVIEPLTPMESPVITTSHDCLRLIKQVGSIAMYAMLDIVPPVVVQEPYSQYFLLLKDKLDYIHICNTDGVTDAHLRLENGVLPITDVINVFKHYAYQGYVTTELYSENYRDPELLLSNTANVLRDIRNKLSL